MSNLFTTVSVEQQEIVAGGFGYVIFRDFSANYGVAIGQNTGDGGNQLNAIFLNVFED
jgi:hypothetical protein